MIKLFNQGTLEDGRMFDSSLANGREPLEFQLGKGKVIKGSLFYVLSYIDLNLNLDNINCQSSNVTLRKVN